MRSFTEIFIKLSTDATSFDSGVARHAHLLQLHVEVYLLCA